MGFGSTGPPLELAGGEGLARRQRSPVRASAAAGGSFLGVNGVLAGFEPQGASSMAEKPELYVVTKPIKRVGRFVQRR